MNENEYYTRKTKWGTIRSDKPPVARTLCRILGVWGLLASLGFILLSIVSFYDFEEEAAWLSIFYSIATLACSFGLFHRANKLSQAYIEFSKEIHNKQEEEKVLHQKYLQEHPYLDAEEFFKQARNAGIPNVDSKANVSRLLLYAKNNGIITPQEKMIEDFNIGKQYVERYEAQEMARQEQVHLEEMREQEDILRKQYACYANCVEQDKSIQICQDEINQAKRIIYQCEQDENSVRRGGEATYLLGHQKESSWAIHGGIASGLAGGAAGFAAAVDTERRNQVKRQQNSDLAKNVASLAVMQLEKIWDRKNTAERNLEYWTTELEDAKLLLCEKLNETKLLSMMHPSVKQAEITKTGAVKITVKLHSTPNLIIYDKINAVVDGSIKVLLKVDGEVVGSAICVLPYGGMTSYATVKGICCKPKKQAQKYTFDFAPNNLWAVETKKSVYDSWKNEQNY